jgi:hypothetical protein
LWPYRSGAMQDPANELLRIPLLGTSVNRPSADVSDFARCHHVSAITLDHK